MSKSSRRHNNRRKPRTDTNINDPHLRAVWPKLKAVQPPPDMACPDCTAVFDNNEHELLHDESCPHSGAVQRASDDDREYFRAHLGVVRRCRPPVMGELLDMFLSQGESLPEPPAGRHWEPAGVVTVTFVSDDVRLRDLRDVFVVATT